MNAPLTPHRSVELNELAMAALRFDTAHAHRALAYTRSDEDAMCAADEAFDIARAEFRRLIAERTGMDADAVEERMSK